MPGRVFVVVTTPDGEWLARCLAEALNRAGKLLLDNGRADGYFVTLTIETRPARTRGPDYNPRRGQIWT